MTTIDIRALCAKLAAMPLIPTEDDLYRAHCALLHDEHVWAWEEHRNSLDEEDYRLWLEHLDRREDRE